MSDVTLLSARQEPHIAREGDKQAFLLLAEPDGTPFFRQWQGAGSITLQVADGKPSLTLKDRKGVVFAKPEDNPWTTRDMRRRPDLEPFAKPVREIAPRLLSDGIGK
jgi:hypothetical protein